MNYSYIRYAVLSLVLVSTVASSSCQTWTELFNQSLTELGTVTRSSIKTVQDNNGVIVVKDFVTKHPIASAVGVLVVTYGLYRLVKPSKAVQPTAEELLIAAHANAEKDFKARLATVVTKMDFVKETHLELYHKQLQEFILEIESDHGQNVDLQSLKPLVQNLLNSLNAYMSLKDNGGNKDELFDALIFDYVLLKSALE